MQDLILSDCQKNVGANGNYASIGDSIKVADRRDGSIYKARYIGGQCFMTSNLKISGTISATDSNFTGQDFNVSENSLCTGDDRYSNACTSGTGYNFYAASAGTVSTNSNTNVPTGDICPAGWRLITDSDLTLLESIGPETYGSAGLAAFRGTSFNRVWAADSATATDRVTLYYDSRAGDFYKYPASRVNLYSVRCTYIEEIYN